MSRLPFILTEAARLALTVAWVVGMFVLLAHLAPERMP